MNKFNHPLARGVSYLLIYLTALQPLHPVFAAGINAANGNTQVQQGNVPVVNIATPNGAGISHNSYKDFNVATPGAVLNNATTAGKSQLAGQLNANPNLKSKAAELIINEVTGSSRSELQGKLEVFGGKANVMIANPNGISCDGCGFINTPSVTLTTGKPQFDKQGALEALEVKKGTVTVGGKGMDGKAQDYVDIISRATELNGQINAKNLSLTLGANRIGFKDGTIKPITGEGAKPQLAVDTKALGGMYANKIRLVATEDGVGVNLKEVSGQQGVMLSANGKITLGGYTYSKTDLNLSAREIQVVAGTQAHAVRDLTLAATTLNNQGVLTAGHDIQVFSDTVRNTGDKAKINAHQNLWIQKDSQGNRSKLVENRSATIQSGIGDLVIRTDELVNKRDVLTLSTQSEAFDNEGLRLFGSVFNARKNGDIKNRQDLYQEDFSTWDKWLLPCASVVECTYANAYLDQWIPDERTRLFIKASSAPAVIDSGKNSYINAGLLWNDASILKAKGDLILTGSDFRSIGYAVGAKERLNKFKPDSWAYEQYNKLGWILPPLSYLSSGEKAYRWLSEGSVASSISAGGNLVADFKNTIDIGTALPFESQLNEVEIADRPETLKAQNILLHGNYIVTTDAIRAKGDISLIAEDRILLGQGIVAAGNTLSLTAVNNIDAWQSELKGQDVTLLARNGEIKIHSSEKPRYFRKGGTYWQGSLEASRDLTLTAGSIITLLNTLLVSQSRNIAMTANGSISIVRNDAMLDNQRLGASRASMPAEARQAQFNQMLNAGQLNATGSVLLNSGSYLALRGAQIRANKDVTLLAGHNIDLNYRELGSRFEYLFPSSRTPELGSKVHAGGNLLINAARDIGTQGGTLSANGNVTLLAGQNLWLAALRYSAIDAANDNNMDDRQLVTRITAGKNMSMAANNQLLTYGTQLTSGSDMMLTSGGNMRFESVQSRTYREGGNEFTESMTQQGSVLNAGGLMTLISNGSILFQATKLVTKSAMDVAAKGGYLYAQAMEESSYYEKKEVKRKWWGKKTEVTRVRHDVTNKVTEFTAAGNISLLSRDDSTYEASKISAGQNARLVSTHGAINFRAVKNTSFEQTVSLSKGFYIKQADKGYTETLWVLPSVYTGGTLTVEAASGISADIKAQNGQVLQSAIDALGNTPGSTWVKNINKRNDVQWGLVKDAYDSWDYKSQSLNPAVAAVIAITVAAVTAGSGLAAMAGNAAVSATGAAGTTAAMVSGAAAAGTASLASQAAVALVENQGNISKTLKALGNSDTVKATATAMAIGGALNGFDSAMGWSQDANGKVINPNNVKLPQLSNGDWSKVVQRVAGQSIIGSSLNTTINGGSFKDNLTNSLLANIGGQVNAEGAKLIGDNGSVLGVPGKMLSHAVVAGVSAEIGRGSGKGAAAGALAAELAGVILGENIIKPKEWQTKSEQQVQIARVIGAVAGSVFTGTPGGAYSGADSAESVTRFNHQEHLKFMFGEEGARYFQGVASLGEQMDIEGLSPEQISAAFVRYAKGDMPEGQDVTRGFIAAWGNFFGIPLDVVMSNQTLDMKKAAEIVASGAPTSEGRLIQYVAAKSLLMLADLKYIKQAESELIKDVSSFNSNTQASKSAAVIGAYDSKTGKVAIGYSDSKIVVDKLHPDTVEYLNKQLGVTIGDFTKLCNNKVGACAEVNAADKLIRQGVRPENIKFTDAYRPLDVFKDVNKELKLDYVIDACKNCVKTWPDGVKK
ncbi:hemagglutinin [Serratia fonticola]|uniref:two-partner secretion domain-containing protein n=1 Tax=Serratia fonticola TaxID=47917 RepID=UPI000BFDF7B0|nr:DUF637 domain-containing protein [Serratia fonticola]ATM77595.1 hemagglutinin [Serratia fonticola]